MTATCTHCLKMHDGDRCPSCKPHRVAAKLAIQVCQANRCNNYGTDHNGRTGCLRLPIPCHLFDRLLIDPHCVDGLF